MSLPATDDVGAKFEVGFACMGAYIALCVNVWSLALDANCNVHVD